VFDRRGTPQQLQRLADLVVRHGGERPVLAEPFGDLAAAGPVVAGGVRVAERAEEDVGGRLDSQRLPGRELDDGGHRFPLATDNGAASRTASGCRRRSRIALPQMIGRHLGKASSRSLGRDSVGRSPGAMEA
jgi:hypothetical protein